MPRGIVEGESQAMGNRIRRAGREGVPTRLVVDWGIFYGDVNEKVVEWGVVQLLRLRTRQYNIKRSPQNSFGDLHT